MVRRGRLRPRLWTRALGLPPGGCGAADWFCPSVGRSRLVQSAMRRSAAGRTVSLAPRLGRQAIAFHFDLKSIVTGSGARPSQQIRWPSRVPATAGGGSALSRSRSERLSWMGRRRFRLGWHDGGRWILAWQGRLGESYWRSSRGSGRQGHFRPSDRRLISADYGLGLQQRPPHSPPVLLDRRTAYLGRIPSSS
jgi:hypothetical protein